MQCGGIGGLGNAAQWNGKDYRLRLSQVPNGNNETETL